MRRLTVEPFGGLANRMRVIASGIALAERAGIPLNIFWCRDLSCNCRYQDLFESLNGMVVSEIDLSRPIARLLNRLMPLRARLAGGNYLGQHEVELLIEKGNGFFTPEGTEMLYLRCCSAFLLEATSLVRLNPVSIVREQVELVTATFDEYTVGIHIRRTDNELARQGSPTEAFVQLMQAELIREPRVRFFLATDDPVEEVRLRGHFPGKIDVYRKRSLDRNEPQAMQDALVDIYCLAGTTKIIGSYWSSFSETAACLGGRELVIAGRVGNG